MPLCSPALILPCLTSPLSQFCPLRLSLTAMLLHCHSHQLWGRGDTCDEEDVLDTTSRAISISHAEMVVPTSAERLTREPGRAGGKVVEAEAPGIY